LVDEGAKVTVVAIEESKEIADWAKKKAISLEKREFRKGDTKGYFLVIAATNDHKLNRLISEEAGNTKLFNSVDEPDLCNFYAGAVIKRGKLRIAISTAGAFPTLTRKIKTDLDNSIPASYGPLLEKLGEFRNTILKKNISSDERKRAFDHVAQSSAIDEFLRGNEESLQRVIDECV
jgi:siroheme synthase-like protein